MGAVYVFTKSSGVWSQQAVLTAADRAAGDSFGSSVGLSKTTALIGAPERLAVTGAAYVYAANPMGRP